MAADPLEKLEAAVRKLATQTGTQQKTLDEHGETLDRQTEQLGEIVDSLKDIQRTQVALTNAMTTAIKQLGIDKTLDIRVKRLEDAVFGSKN